MTSFIIEQFSVNAACKIGSWIEVYYWLLNRIDLVTNISFWLNWKPIDPPSRSIWIWIVYWADSQSPQTYNATSQSSRSPWNAKKINECCKLPKLKLTAISAQTSRQQSFFFSFCLEIYPWTPLNGFAFYAKVARLSHQVPPSLARSLLFPIDEVFLALFDIFVWFWRFRLSWIPCSASVFFWAAFTLVNLLQKERGWPLAHNHLNIDELESFGKKGGLCFSNFAISSNPSFFPKPK